MSAKSKNANRSILVAIGLFLLTKFKFIFLFLKGFKFTGTIISMGFALYFYALVFGWKFGVALIYLIFIHELGHVIAARIKGINTGLPMFIPFVGAFINLKEMPRDAKTEAFLAYGGPFAGLLSFLPAIPLYIYTEDPFWALVIHLGAIINLFNLLPVSPLDGGRIVGVLSPNIWFLGLLALGAFLFISPSPMIVLIFIFGMFSWWSHLTSDYRHKQLQYERDKWEQLHQEISRWINQPPTSQERYDLQRVYMQAQQAQPKKPFTFPLFQEEKKLAYKKLLLDREFILKRWELLVAHEQEQYRNAWNQYADTTASTTEAQVSPQHTLSSEDHIHSTEQDTYQSEQGILRQTISTAETKLADMNTELERHAGYYETNAATRWKVLLAYLVLAGLLAAFYFYSDQMLLELRQVMKAA
ncbi:MULTISPECIES: site-2 protease family protein [Brevibacillus]|uniref:site-2 protease family protein n=1 Tax=Brevibacillus TaxID=55080 RepID=UPI000B9B1058|nr:MULTISPECIES: site-2 protease family protein [Brevibacillus]MCG7320126.1 site-2 protease family protein [Brevibacillus laterosporus]MED1790912.1 site-2 protease family protein [Brevibacillus laterosporus]RFB28261.1 site-2 protease family protein [Brevibacillus sp. VP]